MLPLIFRTIHLFRLKAACFEDNQKKESETFNFVMQ